MARAPSWSRLLTLLVKSVTSDEAVELAAHVVQVPFAGGVDVGRCLRLLLLVAGDLEFLADARAHHARFAGDGVGARVGDLDGQIAGDAGADVLDLAENPVAVPYT